MANYHFSVKVIGRSGGRSAVASAAYRAAKRLHDDALDRDHDYRAKDGVVHSEIMLPAGAPDRWLDRGALWNEVEVSEKRRDSQLARDVEISLPRELSQAEAVALVQDFLREQFVDRGMVADLNVHWTTASDGELQPHAHVMLSMREVVPGLDGQSQDAGFGKKVVAWNDRALLGEWRERWAEMANARLAELGHDARIDHRSNAAQGIDLEPQNKIGPAGARRDARGEEAERAAEHRDIARRNGEKLAAEPEIALDALTHQHSTFTRQDLARFVNRHTDGAEQFATVMAKVEASPELVRLGEDGRGRGRFSTRDLLAIERRMESVAEWLAGVGRHGVATRDVDTAMARAARDGMRLGEEQSRAVRHVTGTGGLALVMGYAGTGKSAMLGVARRAWEAAGLRVQGAALSGIAAEGLEAGSGMPSRTLASLEWAWKDGREQLGPRDVLVVDEAGMVGSRQMERVLSQVRAAGAKVVLVGDPEQLQAIEAGAAFRALAERHGAVEISEIRRQREEWQRQATRALATGGAVGTAAALGRYAAAGMVQGHATREAARVALVDGWAIERAAAPKQSRVILAPTRVDVAELNRLARERLRAAGELGPEWVVQTEQGARALAAGDRVMFLRNERGLGGEADAPRGSARHRGVAVKNGTLGTVEAIDAAGERLRVRLDGPEGAKMGGAKAGAVASFSLRDYGHLDHGYAATIHKAQGVTVDRAHVLAGASMDRHATYVGLTRHRDGVALHYGRDEFADAVALSRGLGRERSKDTTLDYGAAFAERRGIGALAPASEIVARVEAPTQAPIARPAPLLPAHRDAFGRDSLGRGTSPGEIVTVVAVDGAAQRERDALRNYLSGVYRDPHTVRAALTELVKQQGWTKAAAQVTADPAQFGELRGKVGFFAGAKARAEREMAQRGAGAIGASLERIGAAEARAERTYRDSVAEQRARDAVEVPGLSPAAWAAVRAVDMAGRPEAEGANASKLQGAARDYVDALTGRRQPAMAAAWAREVAGRPEVEAELREFAAVARQRLGEDGARDLMRKAMAARSGPGQRTGLAGVGRALAMVDEGERASTSVQQRARETERQRLGQGRGLRM